MSTPNDGGPAYPGPCQHEMKEDIHEGMTLRDYFVGEVVQGELARSASEGCEWQIYREDHRQMLSAMAYDMADALLAEKRRRESGDQ